jgi:hypothetical protein
MYTTFLLAFSQSYTPASLSLRPRSHPLTLTTYVTDVSKLELGKSKVVCDADVYNFRRYQRNAIPDPIKLSTEE